MGTARLHKEGEEEMARRREAIERERRRTELERRLELARLRVREHENEIDRLRAELEVDERSERDRKEWMARHRHAVLRSRHTDPGGEQDPGARGDGEGGQ